MYFFANTHSTKLPVQLFLSASSAETQSERLKDSADCQLRIYNKIPVICSGKSFAERRQEGLENSTL